MSEPLTDIRGVFCTWNLFHRQLVRPEPECTAQFWISGSLPHSRRPREVTIRVACFFILPSPAFPPSPRQELVQTEEAAGGKARPGQARGSECGQQEQGQKRSMRASPASPLLSSPTHPRLLQDSRPGGGPRRHPH